MTTESPRYSESPSLKTKIVATVGPACADDDALRGLVVAGVDVFRLNFAHGKHDWLAKVVASIRKASEVLDRPIGILGDLCGPKIRLGVLPEEGLFCVEGERIEFVREAVPGDPTKLTCTYEPLIDDVEVGDRVLLADGAVCLRVTATPESGDRVVCEIERSGVIRSRQGVNLPGVALSTPSLTDKDRQDLVWALEHELDYIGLSFVRSADDVRLLRETIAGHAPKSMPHIISKIEKSEAIDDLNRILDETDAIMVARGDLGVEVDIARLPVLQKRIIHECNLHRIPVITATQMLESMIDNEFPTRAEASDVANAILDGTDAVMLSAETAIGVNPSRVVEIMSRISSEAEQLVNWDRASDTQSEADKRATPLTEAVTHAAAVAAEHLDAGAVAVATHSGRTAMAISKQRSRVPVLALTDNRASARRMCLYWGVTAIVTDAVRGIPPKLVEFLDDWGRRRGILESGSHLVLVGTTDWGQDGKDLMLVHRVR